MSVSFASYEIARSGLTVNERGLYVTGHNISNVNTLGYVRQQAMIKNGPVQTTYNRNGMLQVGLGADIQQIRQIRHTFLDSIYRQENTTLGYWDTRRKTFQDVEAIMAEPMESGLQNVLNQFWDAWQELSKEPDSLTVRALVRQRGEALAAQINHMGAQLDRLQKDLNSEISVRIGEVNEITSQVAKLNLAIRKAEISGDTANDYRDQRNTLLDRLTKLANVDINEMQDGQIDVTLGGYFLVQKGVSTNLYAAERNAGDIFYVPKLEGTNIEVSIQSGIIKGLMESRGEVSGAVGGVENGTPNTKADITFVVDLSGASGMDLDEIKEKMKSYVEELDKHGVDYNVRLITTNNNTYTAPVLYNKSQYKDFMNKVDLLTTAAGPQTDDFTGIFNEIDGLSFRPDANKYVVAFTNDAVSATDPIAGVTKGSKITVAFPLTVTAGVNDTLKLKIDGEAVTVNIDPGPYANIADMAAELQEKINDATGSAADIAVDVVDGRLRFTSGSTGSASCIQIEKSSTAASNLGLDNALQVTGESEANAYNTILGNNGIKLSVATDTGTGWDAVTGTTGGKLYEDITLADAIGEDVNKDVNKGISVIQYSSNIVSDMRARLNALVNLLTREVNYLHKGGMTMGDTPSAGADFFTAINPNRPLEMGNIRLNPNLSDLNNIAASLTGAKGNNENAREIANLRYVPLLQDVNGLLSTDDYYQAIILTMGNNGSDAARITESQEKLVRSADASRLAITGVSMDEEMTNMMKYKFAYDASSRVLNIVDDMIDTIISRMGVVGR